MMTVAVAIGGGGGAFLLLFDRFGGLGGIFNVDSHGDRGLAYSLQCKNSSFGVWNSVT